MLDIDIDVRPIYDQWGLSSSPFQTTALPPNELGATLITGRDQEIQELVTQLVSPPKCPTIEGLNGVGKTSIANVASYLLFRRYMKTQEGPLLIPCRKNFQLTPGQDIESFIDTVFFEVAQTLIERSKDTGVTGATVSSRALDQWLNSPHLTTVQGGIQTVLIGISGGTTSETNTSTGFERSGFRKAVTEWLLNIFPDVSDGGVVCVIDNLELLQSSEEARALVEQLRDTVFTVAGLRWVLCGALGIVYGVVASPRLDGYLQSPVQVGEVSEQHAEQILSNRLKAFAKPGCTPSPPLLSSDFAQLYKLLHGVLRSVLNLADDYCAWVNKRVDSNLKRNTQRFNQ